MKKLAVAVLALMLAGCASRVGTIILHRNDDVDGKVSFGYNVEIDVDKLDMTPGDDRELSIMEK